jgi:SpoIID/LytB domain protein
MTRPVSRRWARTALVAALLPALTVAAPAAGDDVFDVPASGRLVLNGHGFGHGHGMSQYGAEGAAREGKSWRRIVGFYYPKTQVGRTAKRIRVLISADTSPDVVVRARPGLTVTDRADGRTWVLPVRERVDAWRLIPSASNGSVTVLQRHHAAGWRTWSLPGRGALRGDGQFAAKGPVGLRLPTGETVRYRGALRSASPAPGSSTRDTVNVARMDDYLRGVVPLEMPALWSQQALRAQAVVARTYAAFERRQRSGGHYQICDSFDCQVYGGASAEYPSTDRAVRKTAGRIVTYRGRPAFTQFSSSSGGWTSAGGQPYLAARKDPWDHWSGNGWRNWTRTIDASRLESSYPGIGRLTSIRVHREGNGHWGGRVRTAALVGTAGRVTVTGDIVRFAFGLPSTWFNAE